MCGGKHAVKIIEKRVQRFGDKLKASHILFYISMQSFHILHSLLPLLKEKKQQIEHCDPFYRIWNPFALKCWDKPLKNHKIRSPTEDSNRREPSSNCGLRLYIFLSFSFRDINRRLQTLNSLTKLKQRNKVECNDQEIPFVFFFSPFHHFVESVQGYMRLFICTQTGI